ncbi:MAG: Holliday junction branch migration protein RuvA [Marinilabiliaceae bacterium]
MIEFIRGEVAELTPTYAVIDCGGVGYLASISLNTYSALEGKKTAKLFIHEAIREDAYQLYGFDSASEREVFRLLTSVSGVGAATARVMVSAMSAAELKNVIMSENVKALKGIKGIGLKTAERIVVELKDKIGKAEIEDEGGTLPIAPSAAQAVKEEALQALEVLGYNKAQAAKAVDKILAESPDLKVEGVVKAAFKML